MAFFFPPVFNLFCIPSENGVGLGINNCLHQGGYAFYQGACATQPKDSGAAVAGYCGRGVWGQLALTATVRAKFSVLDPKEKICFTTLTNACETGLRNGRMLQDATSANAYETDLRYQTRCTCGRALQLAC